MYPNNLSYMLCYIPREYMYLDILHVFYKYPNSQRSPRYIWDTHQIHQYTCMYLMRFLDVTLDTYQLYQDTSGYMHLGL